MIHPSYQECIDKINKVNEENGIDPIDSRYTLVIAAAKRARQMGDNPNSTVESERQLSQAVADIDAGMLAVKMNKTEREERDFGFDGINIVDLNDGMKIED